jgi:hypothetical protein
MLIAPIIGTGASSATASSCAASEGFLKAIDAFVQKHAPVFRGR